MSTIVIAWIFVFCTCEALASRAPSFWCMTEPMSTNTVGRNCCEDKASKNSRFGRPCPAPLAHNFLDLHDRLAMALEPCVHITAEEHHPKAPMILAASSCSLERTSASPPAEPSVMVIMCHRHAGHV